MKIRTSISLFGLLVAAMAPASETRAQERYIAYEVPPGIAGNQVAEGGAGNDFYVVNPITIWQLGVFDDLTNSINSGALLTVQLYARNGSPATLLETLSFDTASPGSLIGGSRFKTLSAPVTLLPGPYSIVAYGFDTNNRAGSAGGAPYNNGIPPWTMNDGGGLIVFEKGRYGGEGVNQFAPRGHASPIPNYYAAGTFEFSGTTLPPPPYAADYAALVAGVSSFEADSRRRIGSIALFGRTSFPVLVEPGGNRLIMQAASTYNEDPNGARVVAFTHPQWGNRPDARMTLFENAIRWASRKNNPGEIVIGMGPMFNTNHFVGQGYQVRPFTGQALGTTNNVPNCDVVVVNWRAPFDNAVVAEIAELNARGVGLVITMSPWEFAHGGVQPPLRQANHLLEPFGIAYRPSTTIPGDFRFTNIWSQPYPVYYSAIPAAELLGQNRRGTIRLTSLEKAIAAHTINYALNARPDLLGYLSSIASGSAGNAGAGDVNVSSFIDVVTLAGSQAATNRLGQWQVAGDDLIAVRRGSVEFQFNVPTADLYRIEIEGTQDLPRSLRKDFDLLLALDGVSLGRHKLIAPYGSNGVVHVWTPYILEGAHTLRVLWDNAGSFTSLRLKAVRIQSGFGPDSDDNGIKDWVEQLVRSQSRLDVTNQLLASFVSPVCLEGKDLYPALTRISVGGSQVSAASIRRSAADRWYLNVPLSPDQNTPLIFNVTYQNGAVSEWRNILWRPINLLTTTNLHWTIRKGDSLLLGAKPAGGINAPVVLSIGTNQALTTANNPLARRFNEAGTFTVTGTYSGVPIQSGSITVKVVEHDFPNHPAAWVGVQRIWDLPQVGPEVALEADPRVLFEETAALGGGGRRVSIITDENERRFVVSRLGRNGPILDSARINGFDFWHGGRTYLRVAETYEDGSQLVEMLLVMSPVLPDVTVKLDSIVGGVTFEDGSITKTFAAADFDALGRKVVRFIRPASAQTSVCHSIKIFQGTDLVGYVR